MTALLGAGFEGECTQFDCRDWSELIATFADGSLFQVWQHALGKGRVGASQFVLKHRGEVVSAAEIRLFTVPLTGRGIAYLRWGPCWKKRGRQADPEIFRQTLRGLIDEYVRRRGLILRVVPRLTVEEDFHAIRMLSEEGFSTLAKQASPRTLIVDLAPREDELRKGLDKKWRNCLSKAERSGLTLADDTSLDRFDEFLPIYESLIQRKQFAPSADIEAHRRIQARLPEHLKMRTVVARLEGHACAGAIYTAIGERAIYLFGASNEVGLRVNASYLVQWHILTRVKQHGSSRYDLNGINAELNPGTYHFKKGLAGKHGAEFSFAAQVQSMRPTVANYSVLFVDTIRKRLADARSRPSLVHGQ